MIENRLREKVFSNMIIIMSEHRSRLIDQSLQSCVKIKVRFYNLDTAKICRDVQKQKSHKAGEKTDHWLCYNFRRNFILSNLMFQF